MSIPFTTDQLVAVNAIRECATKARIGQSIEPLCELLVKYAPLFKREPTTLEPNEKFMGRSIAEVQDLVSWLEQSGCDQHEDMSLTAQVQAWIFALQYTQQGLQKDLTKQEQHRIRAHEELVQTQERLVERTNELLAAAEEIARLKKDIAKMVGFQTTATKHAEIVDMCMKHAPGKENAQNQWSQGYNEGVRNFINILQSYKNSMTNDQTMRDWV